MKSVAVVTATTGRATLKQTVQSVAAQTYPCTHYVVYDGAAALSNAHVSGCLPMLQGVKEIVLPDPTGGGAMMNGAICAAAPFLVTEDYICYLDDDNWFEPDHIETMMQAIGDKAYAYCLRKLVRPDGSFYANDDGESLGHHGDMVDVNCYLFKREVCAGIAPLWYKTDGNVMIGDRHVWAALKAHNTPWAATGRYTVNYRISSRWNQEGYFFLRNIQRRAQYPDGFPWRAA